MSFEDAQSYAEWVGKRLPTWFEWEAAARGPSGFAYPWGEEPQDTAALSILGHPRADPPLDGYLAHVRPVGTTPGDQSWIGARDMLGNVSEWTGTMHVTLTLAGDLYPDLGARLVKGQDWQTRVSDWCQLIQTTAAPIVGPETFGFRCAKSASGP